MNSPALITPKQLATYVGKSESWVRAHAADLGGIQIGKEWRFHPSLMDDLTPTPPDPGTLARLCRSTNAAKANGASAGEKRASSASSAVSRPAKKQKRGETSTSPRGFAADFPEYARNAS